MEKDVFEFSDYKDYLKAWIHNQPRGGRGARSKLASALKCHTAYVSQVLNQEAHLSLEQAEEFNALAPHPPEQSEYFLLLVQLARAGTPLLKARLRKQIESMQQKRLLLRNRVVIEK